MRPVFADPKTDFVFKRLFGSEPRIHLPLALLNDLLETDALHRIVSVQLLPPELKPSVQEAKLSIVDVRCTDAQGTTYVIEMQEVQVRVNDHGGPRGGVGLSRAAAEHLGMIRAGCAVGEVCLAAAR